VKRSYPEGNRTLAQNPQYLILRIECWGYVIFVHRLDKGRQFISYRRLQHWLNAVAYPIQNCSTCQQLRSLWLAIEEDCKKHKNQYNTKSQPFLDQIWTKRWDSLWNEQTPMASQQAIKISWFKTDKNEGNWVSQ
jgi:hypothetical protein